MIFQGQPIGITYDLVFYVAAAKDNDPPRRGCVSIAVRKIQQMPFAYLNYKQPKTVLAKNFVVFPGKLSVEIVLEKDIFFQGEMIGVQVQVNNKSKKSVKSIKCKIVQKVDVTITRGNFYNTIAEIESKDGCPICPGNSLTRVFEIMPTATMFKGKKHGIALDGRVRDSDANLACSTLNSMGAVRNDSLGIVVSYTVKVIFNCGALGGDLIAEIPFRLVYSMDGQRDAPSDVQIEDFAKFRRGKSLDID